MVVPASKCLSSRGELGRSLKLGFDAEDSCWLRFTLRHLQVARCSSQQHLTAMTAMSWHVLLAPKALSSARNAEHEAALTTGDEPAEGPASQELTSTHGQRTTSSTTRKTRKVENSILFASGEKRENSKIKSWFVSTRKT